MKKLVSFMIVSAVALCRFAYAADAYLQGGIVQNYLQNHPLQVPTSSSNSSNSSTQKEAYLEGSWKQIYFQKHNLQVNVEPVQRYEIGPIDPSKFRPVFPPFVFGSDTDGDGVKDSVDNCRYTANADQKDSNFDHVGDVCESDYDNDGAPNETDNCPFKPNQNQSDIDGDSIGDVCDSDRDGDGITNDHELTICTGEGDQKKCLDPNKWDTDGDNVSDVTDCAKFDPMKAVPPDCDTVTVVDNPPPPPNPDQSNPFGDDDHDGIRNGVDNCRVVYNPGQQDADSDGVGDACEIRTGAATPFAFIRGGASGCSLVRE